MVTKVANFLGNTAFSADDELELLRNLVLTLVLTREKASNSQGFRELENADEIDLSACGNSALAGLLDAFLSIYAEANEGQRDSIKLRLASLLDSLVASKLIEQRTSRS